ncbi:MAG: hypothetical protein ACFFAU_08090 [Candidatus Hodarchaeota archaeon]
MSEKNLILTCLWKTDEFVITDSTSTPSDEEALLIIDENAEKITARIPSHLSLITQRIIERRVSSIAKSGFTIPKSRLRIGAGFEVSIIKEEAIPDVLLQVGHHYTYDETQIPQKTSAPQVSPSFISADTEDYIPSFLKHDQIDSEIQTIARLEPAPDSVQIGKPEEVPIETPVPEVIAEPEKKIDNDETIAGRFAVALTKTSDIYFARKADHFSIEYSAGRVDFTVKNGEIKLLSTKRISDNDQTLEEAIATATK